MCTHASTWQRVRIVTPPRPCVSTDGSFKSGASPRLRVYTRTIASISHIFASSLSVLRFICMYVCIDR